VEISKFENCSDKTGVELDDHTVYVYSPAMLVIEKLRAICQQMPEYPKRRHAAASPTSTLARAISRKIGA
jgi:hypothetical protein